MARSCQLLDQSRIFIKALTDTKHSTRTQPKNVVFTWAERRKTRDASHLNFEGPDSHDSHDDLYVCGNPCIFERENIPTEVIRDRAECIRSFASSDSAWTISEAEPVSILDHTSFWGTITPDVTFARLSVSIDCQDSRSSGTILTDLRHPPIAIPMRGNCPHTDRCSSFVSISKPTCGSHSDRRQRRNTKSKSTHMSMSMRQQHGTTSHGIIPCSFKYNYRES